MVDIRRASQEATAEVIGVTPRWLREMRDVPRNADKTYDLPVVVAWRMAVKLAEIERQEGGTNGDSRDPNLGRLRLANAQIAEARLKEIQGEVVKVDEVRMATARAAQTLKQRLLGLAGNIAPRVIGLPVEAVAQVIEAEVREGLSELCEALHVDVADAAETTEAV